MEDWLRFVPFLLLLVISTGGLCCNSGWTLNNGTCYQASQIRYDYSMARRYCQISEGNLALVSRIETMRFVVTIKNYDSKNSYWLSEGSIHLTQKGNLTTPLLSNQCPYANLLNIELAPCDNEKYFVCEYSYEESDLECPLGWSLHNSMCYRAMLVQANYLDSAKQCALQRARLAILDDLEKERNAQAAVIGKNQTFYIGAQWDSGIFKWANGKEFHPTDGAVEMLNDSRCVTFGSSPSHPTMFFWRGVDCKDKLASLCEMPASPRTTPPLPTTPPTTLPPLTCPHGKNWKMHENSGYCFWETTYETDRLNWYQARVFCQEYGGDLASYGNEEQEEHGLGGAKGHYRGLWFGLKRGDDDVFRWSDGGRLNYTHWKYNEPELSSRSKYCVIHGAVNGKWELDYCGVKRWFVCKAPKVRFPVIPDMDILKKTPCNVTGVSTYRSWYLFEGHCYMVHENNVYTFEQARTFCQDNGGELASVHSFNETDFILSITSYRPDDNLWIGLNSKGWDSPLEWTDGTFLDFQYWMSESSDYNQTRGVDTCVSFNKVNGAWEENHCNQVLNVICKRTLHSSSVLPTQKPKALVPGNCPKGWFANGNKCVKPFGFKSNELESWSGALNACQNMQASLATIHNQEEQDFLTDLRIEIGRDTWIGLSTMQKGTIFHWIDQSRIDYTNWNINSPHSQKKSYKDYDFNIYDRLNMEYCVSLSYETDFAGKWNDEFCSKLRAYICEKPKDANLTEPSDEPFTCNNITGWLRLKSSCYSVFENPAEEDTWLGAQSTCRKYGANLVSFPNSAVTDFLARRMMRKKNFYWTAIREMREGKYELVNGKPLGYTKWMLYQPLRVSTTMDNCVTTAASGYLIVKSCREKHPFICEWTPEEEEETKIEHRPVHKCPNSSSDWIDLGGEKCYLFKQNAVASWSGAMLYCFKLDGSMISFHSTKEVLLITEYLQKDLPTPNYIHIGLAKRKDGVHSWIDHSPLDFTFWDIDEPDHPQFECVKMLSSSGRWSDEDCDERRRGFVCAINKETVSKNEAMTDDTFEEEKMVVKKLTVGGILGIVICILVILSIAGVAIYYMWPSSKIRNTLLEPEQLEH